MHKKLNDFKKRFNKLKAVDPQTDENKVLKPKVLDNVRDLFNELYYIYKDKYNEEKDGLNTKNKKLFYYKKLRLTDIRCKIIDIVEKILEFNERNQQGRGLKILTPYKMLSRLTITLAQSKAGNNPQKL